MDQRVVEFIAGLRAAGVRVSVAESADALRAVEHTGVHDRDLFRAVLQATLVKDAQNMPTFQHLFPLYFASDEPPPLQQPGGSGQLSPEQQQQLQEMLEEMLQNMTPQQLAQLFEAMMQGQQLSREQMQQMMGQLAPVPGRLPFGTQQRMQQRAMRRMRFDKLEALLQELLDELRAAGMSEEALREIEATARANQQALAQHVGQEVGQQMREALQEQAQQPRPESTDLLDRPFEYLSSDEVYDMRASVIRLAAQLRSRAALRQKRGKTGTLDAKRTIRSNMRYGGVPLEVHHRRRHLKPKVLILCDRSESMRSVTTFLLLLIYTLQDQISRTRTFAFIDDLIDITAYFDESRPVQAIERIMHEVRARRSYSTDLGNSLATLLSDYLGCIDQRTTVIVLGDGRNNFNDPNLPAFEALRRRARRVVWFTPEPCHFWGMYDPGSLNSDMLDYAACCDAVHEVRNLRQLVAAVDTLFT